MKTTLPVVAITMGDPVGIGPEIIPRALADPRVRQCCHPLVYGNVQCLRKGASTTGIAIKAEAIPSPVDQRRSPETVSVIDPVPHALRGEITWGQPSVASATAMMGYVQAAIEDAMAGRIDAMVTGPINKYAMQLADIDTPGHTELLARRTGTRRYAMMLAGERLRVVLVTIHIPIHRIASTLEMADIETAILLTAEALEHRFGLSAPRIAVAGLNPHAGEGGLFGDEEARIIAPAIDRAVARGIDASGPHPPDTIFFTAAQGAYDAVVAMYHDQGLGPFKMIHFDDGVNTTLGLPIIRTSVDHGTAYDIAGQGKASPHSLTAAILMAASQANWSARTAVASS